MEDSVHVHSEKNGLDGNGTLYQNEKSMATQNN